MIADKAKYDITTINGNKMQDVGSSSGFAGGDEERILPTSGFVR